MDQGNRKKLSNPNSSTLWCVARECRKLRSVKRHFFRFPKEHDRWLEWIRACGRYDLKVMGPEYAYNKYRLCHLHFAKKWYKVNKIRPRLHKDAVPTIFYGIKNEWAASSSEDENTHETQEEDEVDKKYKIKTEVNKTNEGNIFDPEKQIKQEEINRSASTHSTTENSMQEKKWDEEFTEIKEKIKVLREIRQTAREDIAKYEEETSYSANATSETQDSPSIKLYVVVGPR